MMTDKQIKKLTQRNVEQFVVRMPASITNRILEQAHNTGTTKSQVIRKALEKAFA